ncbi:MAG TPA: hypothetical protein VHD89_00745, partial [Rhodanobacteraceae bacterium]|nr:hypothetical protein [Rhodanobacteraceae bacterium]
TSQTIKGSSYLFTRAQTGLVHAYGAVMAVGVLALAFHFVVPHGSPQVVGEPSGMKVELEASKGLAYEYRWDFDGDGEFDTGWSSQPTVDHEFNDAEFHRFALVFEGASYGARPRTLVIAPGQQLKVSKGGILPSLSHDHLNTDDFGEGWQTEKSDQPPTITADEHGIVIKPNGTRVRKEGAVQMGDAEVHVARGEHVMLGDARLSVSGYAKPRVQVRNAFGMERVQSVAVVVPKVAPRFTAQVAAAMPGRMP